MITSIESGFRAIVSCYAEIYTGKTLRKWKKLLEIQKEFTCIMVTDVL